MNANTVSSADTVRGRASVSSTTSSIVATSASGRFASTARTAAATLGVSDVGSRLVRTTNVITPIGSCVCGR